MNDLLHMPKCAAYNITADIMEYCIPQCTRFALLFPVC